MTPREKDQLLKEFLTGEEITDFRRASHEQGIALVRLQRKRRQIAQRAALVCVGLLLLALFTSEFQKSSLPRPATPRAQQAVPPAPLAADLEIKWISDEELFALFAGRSMALIGKPGEQQLVFLDQSSDFLE
jgi:hypothetical protein